MAPPDAGPEPSTRSSPPPAPPHILIIGGGIVGLVLAQALRKHYPSRATFTVYERDADAGSRGPGWGLTIYWALATLLELLPPELIARLERDTFVDPAASRAGDGNFLLLDLRSAQVRYRVPPSRRIRVRREGLRRLLMEGVEVEWSKRLEGFRTDGDVVTACFADGSEATGSLLVGCDGSRSRVRQLLCPQHYQNLVLPVRLLGVSVPYPAPVAETMRALDPFFLQAADPVTDTFFWFSFLDTPSSQAAAASAASSPANDNDIDNDVSDATYTCQILTSWPYRAGYLGRATPTDVPATNDERIAFMKRLAADGWAEPFRSVVAAIPAEAEAKTISLEDWLPPPLPATTTTPKGSDSRARTHPQPPMWDHRGGKVTLAGDAAHAMVMFRGEAANHGITDVRVLLEHLAPYLDGHTQASTSTSTSPALGPLVSAYQDEMIARTRPAVLASRRACLDAHEYARITDQSPLVSRRAVVPDDDG
ncbi:MAG: hypothetical protein M1826_005755 [Phylliscum demangeonii]|nr:MAG: hypothetical protein M1826_005755 [Phylliscum demangeonii]